MFERITRLPNDPILGLSAAFREDQNPRKVDLGVGVYKTATGETPVLACVKQAEQWLLTHEPSKSYIAPVGNADFVSGMTRLIMGDGPLVAAGRVATAQAPGGTGALRVGAEFVKRCNPKATVWISSPTWANHIPLFGEAGLTIKEYPYFDAATSSVDFAAMRAQLEQLGADDVVLLHGCCHNPSGADLSAEQWVEVAQLAKARGFLPFIDLAYLGFGDGLVEDAVGVRALAAHLDEFIVASSCSKNFGLYRERVGAISVIAKDAAGAEAALSHLCNVARGIYSMPPSHGAAVAGLILQSAELTASWHDELAQMRDRINGLRALLASKLNAQDLGRDYEFIQRQRGMFSFLGLSKEQVGRLKQEFSIYMVDSSRINVAGINDANVDYVADAVAKVVRG